MIALPSIFATMIFQCYYLLLSLLRKDKDFRKEWGEKEKLANFSIIIFKCVILLSTYSLLFINIEDSAQVLTDTKEPLYTQ